MESKEKTVTNGIMSTKLAEDFILVFNLIQSAAHRTAVEKGWWDKPCNHGEQIALMHSELSEGLEHMRHGNPPDDKVPNFSGLEAELADTVIRIMSYSGENKLRVAEAIIAKMAFNDTREQMHGGKKF